MSSVVGGEEGTAPLRPGINLRQVLIKVARILAALALSVSIHVAGFLALALFPWGAHDLPAEAPSLGKYFGNVTELVILAVMATPCLVTVLLQRGQRDRYSPIVLLSLVIGLESIFMCFVGMNRVASTGIEAYPEAFIQASIRVAYFSSGLALVDLLRLILLRSPQRGRWIALSITVCIGWVGYAQQTLVVNSKGMMAPNNGIVLAEVSGMDFLALNAWGGTREPRALRFVDIRADGGIDGDQ